VIRRAGLVTAAAIVTGLVLASGAAAYWSAAGGGHGLAATGGVARVTGVAQSLHGTVASTSIDISWSPIAVPAGVDVTYVVEQRSGPSQSNVCTTTATLCTVTGLPDTASAFAVTARINGWVGAQSTFTSTLKVASEAPGIDSAPASPSADASPSIAFTHSAFSRFQCTLDGSLPANCSSPADVATLFGGPLANGTHTLTVAARDAYGALTKAAVVVWVVRTDAPAITAAPAPVTNKKTASFTFSHTAYASFRCKLDGAAFSACTSPAAFSSLATGAHSFQVEALDADGAATAITVYGWTIA
jgi:hypothetical protein